MTKLPTKFCRIISYIEKVDPKLFEIMDDLCATKALNLNRNIGGLTFIWPSKETISVLDKIRYGPNIAEGCKIILAHIVRDFLPTAASWNTKKGDIPNANSNKIEIKSVVGTKVTLADDTVIEHDDKFVTMKDQYPEAVWRVTKGSLDYKKFTKLATYEHSRPKPGMPEKKKTVGAGPDENSIINDLIQKLSKSDNKEQLAVSDVCGKLYHFYEYVEKDSNGNAKALLDLKLILDPNIITSFLFTTRSAGSLEPLWNAYKQNATPVVCGLKEYLELVEKNQASVLRKDGGSNLDELNDAIMSAIDIAKNTSEEALNKLGDSVEMNCSTFSSLNLSRYLEHKTLNDILSDKYASSTDRLDMLKDIVEVIKGRANGTSIVIEVDPTKSQSFGTLIKGIIEHVNKFNDSEYAGYPILRNDAYASAKKTCEQFYSGDCALKRLGGMPFDQMSSFLASMNTQ